MTYTHELVLNEHYDRACIIGLANITLFDTFNNTDSNPLQQPPHEMINIRTISQIESLSIILIITAFPLTLIGMVLSALSIYLIYKRKRASLYTALSAGVTQALAVVFYVNGVNTLIDLIGFVKKWFAWSVGLFVAIAAICLIFVAIVLLLKFRPKKPELTVMKIVREE